MKRNLLLLAALSCFANPLDHFPMASLESSSITNSRSVQEKEQWGPENGWSFRELGFFDFSPFALTIDAFRSDLHFNPNWFRLLNGITVSTGDKSISVNSGVIELITNVDTLGGFSDLFYTPEYLKNGTYLVKSNLYHFIYDDEELVTMLNSSDTVFSLKYDAHGVLEGAVIDSSNYVLKRNDDTVVVEKYDHLNPSVAETKVCYVHNPEGRVIGEYNIDLIPAVDTTAYTLYSYSISGDSLVKEFNGYKKSQENNEISYYHSMYYRYTYNDLGILTSWYINEMSESGNSNYEGKGVDYLNNNTLTELVVWGKKTNMQWGESFRLIVNKNENNSVSEMVQLQYDVNYDTVTSKYKTKYTYYPNGWPSSIERLSFQEDGTWKQTSLDSIFYSGEPLGTIPVTKSEKSEIAVLQSGSELLMTLPAELKSEPIALFTMNGRKIDEISPVDGIAKISTKSLSSGVYFYRVRGSEGKFLVK